MAYICRCIHNIYTYLCIIAYFNTWRYHSFRQCTHNYAYRSLVIDIRVLFLQLVRLQGTYSTDILSSCTKVHTLNDFHMKELWLCSLSSVTSKCPAISRHLLGITLLSYRALCLARHKQWMYWDSTQCHVKASCHFKPTFLVKILTQWALLPNGLEQWLCRVFSLVLSTNVHFITIFKVKFD